MVFRRDLLTRSAEDYRNDGTASDPAPADQELWLARLADMLLSRLTSSSSAETSEWRSLIRFGKCTFSLVGYSHVFCHLPCDSVTRWHLSAGVDGTSASRFSQWHRKGTHPPANGRARKRRICLHPPAESHTPTDQELYNMPLYAHPAIFIFIITHTTSGSSIRRRGGWHASCCHPSGWQSHL